MTSRGGPRPAPAVGGSKRSRLQSISILLVPPGRGLGGAGAARAQQLQGRQWDGSGKTLPSTKHVPPAPSHTALQPWLPPCWLIPPMTPSFPTAFPLISAILCYFSSKMMLPPNKHQHTTKFVSFLLQSPALHDY